MFFRHSMKNVARSKGKTRLFFTLITAVTLILSLGISVWSSINAFLLKCQDSYTTIGLIEYVGDDYPNEKLHDEVFEEAYKDFNPADFQNEYSLGFDMPRYTFGNIEGFRRTDSSQAERENAVLCVTNFIKLPSHRLENTYYAFVTDVLYAYKDLEGFMIVLPNIDFEPNTHDRYLIMGKLVTGVTAYLNLIPTPFDNSAAVLSGVDVESIDSVVRLDGPNGYELTEDSIYYDVADSFRDIANALYVTGTTNLSTLYEFNQQLLHITKGDAFTKEQYENAEKVCIVSQLIAENIGKTVGDKVKLSTTAIENADFLDMHYAKNGFSTSDEYTIVGIFDSVPTYTANVYVPYSENIDWVETTLGYTVGSVIIDNDHLAEYRDALKTDLPNKMTMTIYDQGYSSIAEPLKAILKVAVIVSVVCAVAALAILLLFGFLYIYRQRETTQAMLSMGTYKRQVMGFYLYGAGGITLVAVAIGSVLSYLLSGLTHKAIGVFAQQFNITDARYSDGNLSAKLNIAYTASPDIKVVLYIALAVFALSCIFCIIFALATFSEIKPRRKRQGPSREMRSSKIFGGRPMKYAMLSTFRSGARSIVTPILAIAIICFLGQLSLTSAGYEARLLEIKENTSLQGRYTDFRGKYIDNLVVDAKYIHRMLKSGYLEDFKYSMTTVYSYMGVMVPADERDIELAPENMDYPNQSSYAFETFYSQFLAGSKITFTNDIKQSQEFYYSDYVDIQYAPGYDASFLEGEYDGVYPNVAISNRLMRENGIKYGDIIRISMINGTNEWGAPFAYTPLRVVASFEPQSRFDNIYCQMDAWCDFDIWSYDDTNDQVKVKENVSFYTGYAADPSIYFLDDDGTMSMPADVLLRKYVFNSVSFTVKDTFVYDEFRDYLEDAEFTPVNSSSGSRMFVVLSDQAFVEATNTLSQQITYVKILYPLLYILVGVVAFIASYLLIVGRKGEFAIMRGVGATKFRTFLTFFLEQALLCVIGCVLGLVAWYFYAGMPSLYHLLLTCGFIVCFFIGCIVSIRIMNNSTVLSILGDEE